jgi:hypothetical protein
LKQHNLATLAPTKINVTPRRYETKTTTVASEESIEFDEDEQPFMMNNWVNENTKVTPILVTASSTSKHLTSCKKSKFSLKGGVKFIVYSRKKLFPIFF